MNVKYLKLKNWLVVSLMGALGLSSCHSTKQLQDPEPDQPVRPDPREEMRVMYGVPSMDFRVRGQVIDPQGKPVPGVDVNMLERGMEVKDGELQGDPERVQSFLDHTSVTTDDEGRFEIRNSGMPQETVRLMVRDVDGAENGGEYKNQVLGVQVESEDMDRTGYNGWYQGTFKKEVQIKLESK